MTTIADRFEAVCALDDLIDWLNDAGYEDEAEQLKAVSDRLTGDVVLSVPPPARE